MSGFELMDAGSEAADLLLQMFNDTVPDGLSNSFSAAYQPSMDGFGPGNYSGGYTGQGDAIYWGPLGDNPSSTPSIASHNQGVGFGPGGLAQQIAGAGSAGGSITSSTGQTVLLPIQQPETPTHSAPGSQTTTVDADPNPGLNLGDAPDIGGDLPAIPEVPVDTGTEFSGGTSARGSFVPTQERSVRSALGSVSADTVSTSAGTVSTSAGTANKGGGSIEMQQLGDAQFDGTIAETAQMLFDKHYIQGEGFNPVDIIKAEYGGERYAAQLTGEGPNAYFLELQNELAEIWMDHDAYGGDGASEVLTQADDDHISGSLPDDATDAQLNNAPNLPDADSAGGGSIEMQELNVDESVLTDPSFIDTASLEEEKMGVLENPEDTPIGDDYDPLAFKDGSPVMLDDIPPSEPFSWEQIDPTVDPEFAESLISALSEENALSLGSGGVGTLGLGAVGQFMKNRATDLLVGQVLGPLFSFIDNATDTPWVSRSIQGVLSLYGLVAGGDPFGVIATPISWGIMEYMKQRQRLVSNKDPEAERGKKFGYVREGDKWYPAIQVSKERDEGWVGSNKTQVNFQYGTEIKWKKGKAGQGWVPYFEKGQYRSKNFHVWDSEVDDPDAEGGEEYQKRVDPLRDFFYLTEEQTHEYLMNIAGGSTVSDVSEADRTDRTFTDEEKKAIQAAQAKSFTDFGSNVHDDVAWSDWWAANGKNDTEKDWYAQRGSYVDQMQDIRKSLEFMHGYRFSDEGTVEAAQGTDEFEGSREFRQQLNDHDYLGLPTWLSESRTCNPMGGCHTTGTNTKALSGRLGGKTEDEVWQAGLGDFQESAEMRWLTDEYYRQLGLLYKTQKEAGKSKGFDKLYKKPTDDEHSTGRFFDNLGPNAGWSLYQDGTWGFGHLDTTAQLRAAIEKIEASGDTDHIGSSHYRNADQLLPRAKGVQQDQPDGGVRLHLSGRRNGRNDLRQDHVPHER